VSPNDTDEWYIVFREQERQGAAGPGGNLEAARKQRIPGAPFISVSRAPEL
jgi:hypothetical protein